MGFFEVTGTYGEQIRWNVVEAANLVRARAPCARSAAVLRSLCLGACCSDRGTSGI